MGRNEKVIAEVFALYERFGDSDYIGEPVSQICLLYTSPSPRDGLLSRMPSSA